MINKLPFFFESEGVDYFYDDSTGIVLPINEDEKEFLNRIEIGSSIEDYEYTQEQSVLVEKIKRYNLSGMHKLAVDVEGNFHICEKINPNYPIGNINEGLNYKKIANYLNELVDLLDENCKDCNITRMCNMCFVNIASDGHFVFNKDLCDEVKMSMKSTLGLYYYLLQND